MNEFSDDYSLNGQASIIIEQSDDDESLNDSPKIEKFTRRGRPLDFIQSKRLKKYNSCMSQNQNEIDAFKSIVEIKDEGNDENQEKLKKPTQEFIKRKKRRETMGFQKNISELDGEFKRRHNVLFIESRVRKLSKINELNLLLEENQIIEMKKYLYERFQVIMDEDFFLDSDNKIVIENIEEIYQTLLKDPEERPDTYSLIAIEMNAYEKVETIIQELRTFIPFYQNLIYFFEAMKFISKTCGYLVKAKLFDVLTFTIILLNCFTIAISTSYEKNQGRDLEPLIPTVRVLDFIFLSFYFAEMILKIIAKGFAINKNSYMRDPWNFLDFMINSSAILGIIFEDQKNLTALQSLRAIRVLRPLRTISKIKSLRILLLSLISAFPLLVDTFLILLFSFFFFGIAGLHLFSGILLSQCYYIDEKNVQVFTGEICGNSICSKTSTGIMTFCGKATSNPNYDTLKFDDIFSSLRQVYQIVTLDKWTSIMYSIQKGFSNYTSIYFISVVIFGSFFLMNLTLAIIKVKFSYIHDSINNKKQIDKKQNNNFDLWILKKLGIWRRKKYGFGKFAKANVFGIEFIHIDRKIVADMLCAYEQVKIKPKKPLISKMSSFKKADVQRKSLKEDTLEKALAEMMQQRGRINIKKLTELNSLENQHFKRIYTILQRRDRKSELKYSNKIPIRFLKSICKDEIYESNSERDVILKKRFSFNDSELIL